MKREVGKRVYKEIAKLPLYAQIAAKTEMDKVKEAASFRALFDVADVKHVEGTDEPYYRLKFGKYRYITYYSAEIEQLKIILLAHRKDAYKKQNQPWRW